MTLKPRFGSVWAWKSPLPASNSGPTPRRDESNFLSDNHFFALFTDISSLSMGGALIAWGAVLGTLEIQWPLFVLNRYSAYFGALLRLALLGRWPADRLQEVGVAGHLAEFDRRFALGSSFPGGCDE